MLLSRNGSLAPQEQVLYNAHFFGKHYGIFTVSPTISESTQSYHPTTLGRFHPECTTDVVYAVMTFMLFLQYKSVSLLNLYTRNRFDMKYLKIIFALILFTGGTTVYGQNVGDLMKKAKAMGLSESDIQNQLKNSGISGVSGVGSVADVADDNEIDPFLMMDAVDREASMIENMAFSQEEHVRMRDSLSRVVFGREIFSIKSLSFEPAYNIATPVDYRLGPGDEIVLDVWGQSEANYRQKISPEGTITIKDVGVYIWAVFRLNRHAIR